MSLYIYIKVILGFKSKHKKSKATKKKKKKKKKKKSQITMNPPNFKYFTLHTHSLRKYFKILK